MCIYYTYNQLGFYDFVDIASYLSPFYTSHFLPLRLRLGQNTQHEREERIYQYVKAL